MRVVKNELTTGISDGESWVRGIVVLEMWSCDVCMILAGKATLAEVIDERIRSRLLLTGKRVTAWNVYAIANASTASKFNIVACPEDWTEE